MPTRLIRIMGESDIVDIDMDASTDAGLPLLMGLVAEDRVNILGHWMDQDRGEKLAADPAHLAAMTLIAKDHVENHAIAKQFDVGANFIVVTVLREKWPVGSKAKFQTIANRVSAEHTYVIHPCGAAKIENLDDDDLLKQSETNQLAFALPFFKKNRRRFANSSAVQGLIKQGFAS
ncbi:hypothetical protein [Candidatus Puniceispirillum marinum]|uniref:Glycosyl transferase group 1 n=1 Tax=Puniceispirillum marinum (strain IMCC1322) TaxID=488538 RepID=D5BRN2_PUNMI|nr:hypothetical protein [Candidatus Puniceispirillum marinum]ADE38929.1 glycosyl transferase group 1 [Candidatus Puniceispirillum marinum IMCC1322]